MRTLHYIIAFKVMSQLFIICISFLPIVFGSFLTVQNNGFSFGNQKVFLSGANIAWYYYGMDFGGDSTNSYYSNVDVKTHYQSYITNVLNAGGNVIRVWIHADGQYSPKWDQYGYALGTDVQNMITDLSSLLDFAATKNVFVILTLWNLATKPQQNTINLFWDDSKLQRYFDNFLTPLVTGLKNKKALAAYEAINEPEGSIMTGTTDSNPCFDTNKLTNSGANWAQTWLSMKQVLNVVNQHIAKIKTADPKALVTQGSWSERSSTDVCSYCFNYYKDACLVAAGNKINGVIDFYSIHTYTWQNAYSAYSPMKRNATEYLLGKPIVIGEFSTACSESKNATANFLWGYQRGYSGIQSWQYNESGDCADTQQSQNEGMSAIRNMTINGVIGVNINSP